MSLTPAHCVESLSKNLNPHCDLSTQVKKEMGTGILTCQEGKTDSFVQEDRGAYPHKKKITWGVWPKR